MNTAALMLVEICLFLPIIHYLPKTANYYTLKYSFQSKGICLWYLFPDYFLEHTKNSICTLESTKKACQPVEKK